jgi:hypothetical protein
VAREAGAAVGADEVLGGQIVGAIRAGDMDGDAVVVVVETGQGVTPTNVHVVFGCPLGKHMDQPALLNGDHEELGVGHRREIQWEARKHRPRSRFRRILGPCERAVQTSMVENTNALAHDAVDPWLRVGAGHRIQDHRPDPRQSQFAGKHEPIRTAARDDDFSHSDHHRMSRLWAGRSRLRPPVQHRARRRRRRWPAGRSRGRPGRRG